MQILIHTDKNIPASEGLNEHVRTSVEKAMAHFADHVTRVEVHLSDENGEKSGKPDQKCVMEARPRGMQPLAVTHLDSNLHQAIIGAAEKLHNLVANQRGKLESR
ncbi:MAG: HPF/RaiA family ribosome-associated protein [Flavobacteriales bacterium]|nr:HPF/RaiA family ribosome-associated protein [Flavobacteriales bacterium]MCC6937399.1 HPF/RaiA family ribosome-associated protein [Flavobacteriales bacterium]